MEIAGLSLSGLYLMPTIIPVSLSDGIFMIHKKIEGFDTVSDSEQSHRIFNWLKESGVRTLVMYGGNWNNCTMIKKLANLCWIELSDEVMLYIICQNNTLTMLNYVLDKFKANEIKYEDDQFMATMQFYMQDKLNRTKGAWQSDFTAMVCGIYGLYSLKCNERSREYNSLEHSHVFTVRQGIVR